MKKLIVAVLVTAGLLAGGAAKAGVTVCYDVEVNAAGSPVVDEAACQKADLPAPPV